MEEEVAQKSKQQKARTKAEEGAVRPVVASAEAGKQKKGKSAQAAAAIAKPAAARSRRGQAAA